ncbi:30S ribosomal protein S31, chloroplastic-like [Senna tora]|uniref:30S ribosomal protein S31, chloroplastic-like n=1 Tax=Senna tora TaxID=362788 RepID=A0A834TRG0_9FABA|nr:30S ribosomal protein S31, chloroplastic-like [Senna tora]
MASLMIAAAPSLPSLSHKLSSRLSFSHSQTLTTSPSLFTPISSSLPPSPSSYSPFPSVYCGRGDKKTAKGKRFNHSFGNARPRDKKKGRGPPRLYTPPAPSKKDKYEDNEVVKIEIDESLFSG